MFVLVVTITVLLNYKVQSTKFRFINKHDILGTVLPERTFAYTPVINPELPMGRTWCPRRLFEKL